LVVGLLWLCIWWLAHPRIAGAPDWFESIGLLRWLRRLDPLDKWVGIVATFAAVFVALFQDRLRIWLLRAKLEVRVEPGVSIPWGPISAHHFRLGVSAKGSIAAEFVEILITEIWMAGEQLTWWSPMALGWTDGNESYRDRLSGNTTRLCDFIMMVRPGPGAKGVLAPDGFTRAIPDFDFGSRAGIRIMAARTPRGGLTALLPGR
jgi:hypothetical protein